MKIHLSFQTHDLDVAVAFYKNLLHCAPVKHYDDYAFFVTDDPGLELALNRSSGNVAVGSAHYGIAVHDADAVMTAIARLKDAGYPIDIEREETCCYAKQTKVWTSDPDGRRWEVYTVLEESEIRDGGVSDCCSSHSEQASCGESSTEPAA